MVIIISKLTYNNPVNWLKDAWSDFFLPDFWLILSSEFFIVENEKSDFNDCGVFEEGEGEEGELIEELEDSDFNWGIGGGGGLGGGIGGERGGGVELELELVWIEEGEGEEGLKGGDKEEFWSFSDKFLVGLGGLAGGLGGFGGGPDDVSISFFNYWILTHLFYYKQFPHKNKQNKEINK